MKSLSRHIGILLLSAFGLVAILTACSTQKDGWAHRSYHNTTSRYNGYFNAKESVKAGITTLETGYAENYTEVLPIYIHGDEVSSKSLFPQMDKAIEKSSIVIDRHSMPKREVGKTKKVEYCKWIDDNYFLIGKAYFYKHEFEDAKRHFEYVSRSPEYKHASSRFDAMLWLSKTYIELEQYDKAQQILDILEEAREEAETKKKGGDKKDNSRSKKKRKKKRRGGKKKKSKKSKKFEFKEEGFPKYLKDDVRAVQADLFIRQGRYGDAIPPLEEAAENARPKQFRARLYFIIAQLYEEEGDRNSASLNYTKVIKLHPEYEMEFYATIYRALNANTRSSDTKGLRAELLKMLKDEKNSQWFDQIYYVLADLELRDRNKEQAIVYLKESTKASVDNNRQKGLSFLKLGDIYFKQRDYRQAQSFYDSTATFLPKDHENYDAIANKSIYLTELVGHLTTIEVQDSLLELCAMSEAERMTLIADIIEKKREERERQRQIDIENQLNPGQQTGNRPNQGGKWYFYNPNAKAVGFSEFRREWGERKLEDNWRRSSKTTQLSSFETEGEEGEEGAEGDGPAEGDDLKPEFYTKDLPCGDEAKLAASHDKIVDALYGAGIIYKEKLSDNKEAIGAFTNLVSRYDSCKYQLPGYYQLYRLHLTEGNEPEANKYKNLLSKYPDSEYWKIIIDPNYKQKDAQQRIADKAKYEGVFDQYQRGFYLAALNSANKVIETEPENFFLAKYYMLKAQASSQLNQMENVEPTLRLIIDKFPGTEEATKAQEYLNLLAKMNAPEVESPFKMEDETTHLFVIIFPDTKGSIKHIVNKVSTFNNEYYRVRNFKTRDMLFGTEDKAVVVKTFANKKEARDYWIAFKNEEALLKGVNDSYDFFAISQANFQKLYADRQYDLYQEFFEDNYVN